MSGLVTGLQNRAQRFESASDLQIKHLTRDAFFVLYPQEIDKNLIYLITHPIFLLKILFQFINK